MANVPACYELIQSLDKAEKIHFKRYLSYESGKGETVYLRLFNELDKMKSYDETKLERKFKGEKFMKHLPVSLNYLYTMLLNSLVNFHAKKDDRLKAEEMLGEIRILFKKRLFTQCAKQIKRARKFMEEREYSFYLYLLGAFEYNLTIHQLQKNELEQRKSINKERETHLSRLQNELSAFDLNNQMARYMREKELNPDRVLLEEIDVLEQQLRDLRSRLNGSTTVFKLFYLSAEQRFYYLRNQVIKSLKASHEELKTRRNLPKTLQYSLNADLTTLKNHTVKSVELWFVDEAEYWLPEFDVIRAKKKSLQHKCDLLKRYLEFHILLRRGAFEDLENFVPKLLADLDILLAKNVTYYHIWMYESLALYYFLTGDMRECLVWIDKTFEQKDVDDSIRQRIVNTRLMEMMAHFNLENYQLIKSLCRSFERSLKKLQKLDSEFVEEFGWIKKMKRVENYILPRQTKDFVQTLLPEGYFSIPPNYRLVLISVWGEAHKSKISLRESWTQHTENILSEMKSTTRMERLGFEKITSL